MSDFKKIVRVGSASPRWRKTSYPIFCKISYTDGKLSISGVEGPYKSGNCAGACGQIDSTIKEHIAENHFSCGVGWTMTMVRQFLTIWEKWHLNDMQAGTPAQSAAIKAARELGHFEGKGVDYYTPACELLKKLDLLVAYDHPDHPDGYKYGSRWLTIPVPAHAIEFLKSLPETDQTPAWV